MDNIACTVTVLKGDVLAADVASHLATLDRVGDAYAVKKQIGRSVDTMKRLILVF